MNVSSEIQSAKSDILSRATEVKFSYQARWSASVSALKAIRGSIKPSCLSWPQRRLPEGSSLPEKFLCERAAVSSTWERMRSRAPASPPIFTTWRLQHVQGQNSLINGPFCGCARVLSAHVYVSLLSEIIIMIKTDLKWPGMLIKSKNVLLGTVWVILEQLQWRESAVRWGRRVQCPVLLHFILLLVVIQIVDLTPPRFFTGWSGDSDCQPCAEHGSATLLQS